MLFRSVEQQFSAGGNILDPTRSFMSLDSIEAQSCLDDWTKEVFRHKKKNMNKRTNSSKMSKQPAQKGATPTTSFVIVWFQLSINKYKNYVGFDFSKPQEDT